MDDLGLVVLLGPAAGTQIDIEDELLIGRRASGSGLLGGDEDLSRRHALVRRSGSQLVIVDLGSTNGPRVNGRPISGPTELHPGDRVELGASLLEVRGAARIEPAGPVTTAPGAAPVTTAPGAAPVTEVPGAAPVTTAPGAPPDRSRAAGQAVPPFSAPPVDRGGGSAPRPIAQIVLAVVAAAALAAAVILLATRGSNSSTGGAPFDGTVYVETNVAKPDQNSILALRYAAGSFRPLHLTEYPTGGSGSHDLLNRGVLDADGQVIANRSGTLLFAVNQGSDSIAVFRIADNGSLTPVRGSPFPSGGTAPTSLALSGNILVVANKAFDGVRDLTHVQPNYTTFRVAADGSLRSTGSTILQPPMSAPIQVDVAPGGRLVFASEESGLMLGFQLSPSGQLTQAPGSPYRLPNSLFARHQRPHIVWPAGLSFNPSRHILYSGVPNYGTIVAYDYDADGRLTLDGEEADPNGFLPCWSVVSANGRWLYFANAGTDNISVWDIASDPRHPRLLQTAALPGGGNPWNLGIDPSGQFLYIITPRQVAALDPAGTGQLLHSLRLAANGTLKELPSSPVTLPATTDTNPFGLAIVRRR